jgi:hypothetical protein
MFRWSKKTVLLYNSVLSYDIKALNFYQLRIRYNSKSLSDGGQREKKSLGPSEPYSM